MLIHIFLTILLGLQEFIQEEKDKAFYEESEDEDEEDEDEEGKEKEEKDTRKPYVMDSDHRLLLRSVKPLLQSRNAAVSTQKKKRCQEILYGSTKFLGGGVGTQAFFWVGFACWVNEN